MTVTVGEPVELGDITCRCNAAGKNQQQVRGRGHIRFNMWTTVHANIVPLSVAVCCMLHGRLTSGMVLLHSQILILRDYSAV